MATLKRFGELIQQLNTRCDDPDVRFWAFVSYISDHPAQLLTASPPPELADRVANLLADANLPIIAADLKPLPEETGPPQKTIAVPDRLLQAYLKDNEFFAIDSVQVRRKDGEILNGALIESDGVPQFMFGGDIEMISDDIVAIRKAPGCLIGWLVKPQWIELPNPDEGRTKR
ncbi:MAG TPA: hypothetical protein VMM76_10730 [Pirellulaceae bacterium]|nr:hypothetical protein [Pirellulaceae bacterium]